MLTDGNKADAVAAVSVSVRKCEQQQHPASRFTNGEWKVSKISEPSLMPASPLVQEKSNAQFSQNRYDAENKLGHK
jgi:hypothetical protein